MKSTRSAALALAILACVSAMCRAADDAGSAPRLTVVDEQAAAHEITPEVWSKLPRVTTKAVGSDGQKHEYEGVALAEVLKHCGVVLGKDLRGPRVANYVLLEARDGYRVVLAIGEVDPATTDKVVLLADRRDGAALDDKEGPFRLVIPDEKRPVRWIRMVTRITVRQPPAE